MHSTAKCRTHITGKPKASIWCLIWLMKPPPVYEANCNSDVMPDEITVPLFLLNFDLQNYNTLGVPVTAQYYVSVADEEELLEALNYAASEKLPLLILGGGSNIVLCDDFPGLVIHIRLHGKTLV